MQETKSDRGRHRIQAGKHQHIGEVEDLPIFQLALPGHLGGGQVGNDVFAGIFQRSSSNERRKSFSALPAPSLAAVCASMSPCEAPVVVVCRMVLAQLHS